MGLIWLGIAAGLLSAVGCTKPREIPPAEVETVEAYGLTLDESANPKQVAYVLLRSLAEDVHAAQAHETAKQREAVNQTFRLAAYSTIEQRKLESMGSNQSSLGDDRAEKLFEVVNFWAPIVAHYVDSLPQSYAAAEKLMRTIVSSDQSVAHVYLEVSHDPSATQPAERQDAMLDIELAKERAEGKSYWRVAKINFVAPNDKLPIKAKPTTTTATGA